MKKVCFILLALIVCVSFDGFCQKGKKTVKQVQAEAAKAKKEIERTSKLLKETEKSKSISIERSALPSLLEKFRSGLHPLHLRPPVPLRGPRSGRLRAQEIRPDRIQPAGAAAG